MLAASVFREHVFAYYFPKQSMAPWTMPNDHREYAPGQDSNLVTGTPGVVT
jgi:hypothetical protein